MGTITNVSSSTGAARSKESVLPDPNSAPVASQEPLPIEREYLEERLRVLETAVREAADSIVITDADLEYPGPHVIYVNNAFERLSGYQAEEVLGHTPRVLQGPGTDREERRRLRQVLESGRQYFGEVTNYRKDGTTYEAELSISPVRDEHGRITNYVGIQRDVTHRRRAMEALEMALQKERELGELKARFVSMASHELRTPLATIKGAAELLERFGSSWEEEKKGKQLQRIRENVDALVDLLQEILFVSEAEEGKLALATKRFDVSAFSTTLIQGFQNGRGARHRLQLDKPATPIYIEGDPTLFPVMLNNLLENAIKYSPVGSAIQVHIAREAEHATIQIADEGIGIPEADQARLFEPFHRGANVETIRGTGLGLTIVRRAIEAHAGNIRIESTEGRGTTVTITLPALSEPG